MDAGGFLRSVLGAVPDAWWMGFVVGGVGVVVGLFLSWGLARWGARLRGRLRSLVGALSVLLLVGSVLGGVWVVLVYVGPLVVTGAFALLVAVAEPGGALIGIVVAGAAGTAWTGRMVWAWIVR